jgi:hypothetical protein
VDEENPQPLVEVETDPTRSRILGEIAELEERASRGRYRSHAEFVAIGAAVSARRAALALHDRLAGG